MAAGTAEIRIEPADQSDEELRQLARWLRDEDELRGKVDLSDGPITPGHMGTAEMVTVLVTSNTATALVTSLFTWLGRRRESAKVTVTVESASGDRIDLSCASPADADNLLRVCRKNPLRWCPCRTGAFRAPS